MDYHNSFKQLEIYKIASELSDHAWIIYNQLPNSLKYHMGDQLLRSIDSVGANIAEGHGRYHFKDQIRFLYNSRGSITESSSWISLMFRRKLIRQETLDSMNNLIELEGKKLNQFIKYLRNQLNSQ